MDAAVCLGCLGLNGDLPTSIYNPRCSALLSYCNGTSTSLCAVCKSLARKAELFLQNVKIIHELLENYAAQVGTTPNLEDMRLQLVHVKFTYSDITFTNIDEDGNVQEKQESWHQDSDIKPECGLRDDYATSLDTRLDVKMEPQSENESNYENLFDFTRLKNEPFEHESIIEEEKKTKTKRKYSKHNSTESTKNFMVKQEKDGMNKERFSYNVECFIMNASEFQVELAQKLQTEKYNNALFKCPPCGKGFAHRSTYDAHMEKHTDKYGKYVCDMCGQHTRNENSLAGHRLLHFRRYHCPVCQKGFSDLRLAFEHCPPDNDRGSESSRVYQCDICAKVFQKRTRLRKHLSYIHRPKQRVKCEVCNKMYSNEQCLRAHIKRKHGSKMDRVHKCEFCDAHFPSVSHVKAHMLRHSDKKEFYCVECDKYFKSAMSLSAHLTSTQTHGTDRDKRFTCKECPERFFTKRQLERHINTVHLKIKPYQCDHCSKTFRSSTTMKSHIKVVHEGKKPNGHFPCGICGRVFKINTLLTAHMRVHTGERPYSCSLCPATFGHKSSLWNHNTLIHLKKRREPKHKLCRTVAGV